MMHVKIANPELKERYVPRLNVTEGIYLGDALVTVKDDKAYLQVINTNKEEEEVYIPTIKIYKFEINIEMNTNSNTNSSCLKNSTLNSNSSNSISNLCTNSNLIEDDDLVKVRQTPTPNGGVSTLFCSTR